MVQVNVAAVVHLTHLFLPAMVERRSGYVMIVASTAAFQPVPYISTYAATKGFDLLFAEGLAEELRPPRRARLRAVPWLDDQRILRSGGPAIAHGRRTGNFGKGSACGFAGARRRHARA